VTRDERSASGDISGINTDGHEGIMIQQLGPAVTARDQPSEPMPHTANSASRRCAQTCGVRIHALPTTSRISLRPLPGPGAGGTRAGHRATAACGTVADLEPVVIPSQPRIMMAARAASLRGASGT
jgi:hypothetical protein